MPSFRVELHSHCQGDPVDSYLSHTIFEHIDRAKEVGLNAIAVTWHRGICDNPEATAYARERGVLLIPGMEADMDGQHHLVVNWIPGRVNPNLRAARWAHKHGKTLLACSDAHTLRDIGSNASTVEADDFSVASIFAGIRAARVTFHRRALDLAPLIYATGKAMSSQPRHIGRWVKHKLKNRTRYPKAAPGFEVQS
jgi:predicted metal-dependent phosphoesterase TrpH